MDINWLQMVHMQYQDILAILDGVSGQLEHKLYYLILYVFFFLCMHHISSFKKEFLMKNNI